MGASEDRANLRAQQRESAVRYLIDLLTSAPEPDDDVSDDVVLVDLRAELDSGGPSYRLEIPTTEDGFLAMPPAQIAELLIGDVITACQQIRRERRVLSAAPPRPNFYVGNVAPDSWAFSYRHNGQYTLTSGFGSPEEATAVAERELKLHGIEPVGERLDLKYAEAA